MKEVVILTQRNKLINITQSWLYIEDIEAIDILYGTIISHYLPGEPVWLFFIGPPGGTKTELLRAFQGDPFYTISTITPQTLISGLNKKGEVDLLPHLDRKVLVVKDFTSILSRDSKEQAQIIADLRDCYDGYLEKAFGSGVGKKGYHSKFDLIAGVTPAIDMYRVIHGVLGERFLKCRIHTDETKAINKATELMGMEDDMRTSLSDMARETIEYYANRINDIPRCDNSLMEQVKALGNVTAKLRSEVARDRYHTVLYYPEAEIGTRLTKQLLKLAQALSIYREHDTIEQGDIDTLVRVARDCVPRQRLEVMKVLLDRSDYDDSTSIGEESNIPTQTAKETLEELWMLKLLDRQGKNTFEWCLNDRTRSLLEQSRILEGVNTQNTMYARINK